MRCHSYEGTCMQLASRDECGWGGTSWRIGFHAPRVGKVDRAARHGLKALGVNRIATGNKSPAGAIIIALTLASLRRRWRDGLQVYGQSVGGSRAPVTVYHWLALFQGRGVQGDIQTWGHRQGEGEHNE